ncbi:flavin-containing monooxygenase [Mycolicibacterium sp. XJ1819]
MASQHRVLVIGSGPAGLSCAAELIARGVHAEVLERGTQPAAAWAGRYDVLRFNTCRHNSALPGAAFPRDFGQFPTRDQYVGYLRTYAASHRVPVRLGVEVSRIEPAPDGGWAVVTNHGTLISGHVVVATGVFNRPTLPPWADGHDFGGRLLHAAHYRNASAFAGDRVLVVGAGSTGLEIAHELSRSGASVRLSVRTPPNILLREIAGLPGDLPLPLFLRLPTGLVDKVLLAMQRRVIGDLSAFGIGVPAEGPIAGLKRRGGGTAIVDRGVVNAIRDGSLPVVSAVDHLAPGGAVLVDGSEVEVDSIIAATGYRAGLDAMVGHLDVLTDRGMPRDGVGGEVLPGLRFVGYVYRPGLTKFVGVLARRVARDIAGTTERRAPATAARPAPGGC